LGKREARRAATLLPIGRRAAIASAASGGARTASEWRLAMRRARAQTCLASLAASRSRPILPIIWRTAMRAIVIDKFGGPENLVYTELPEPEPTPGHVVIEIRAFGVNHAEMHMRRGQWAEAAKVSGIECVGVVKACPGGELPIGAKVAAL